MSIPGNTYLHAGAGKGWPHDHSVDDTYEPPAYTWTPRSEPETQAPFTSKEYAAVYDGKGRAILVFNEDKQTTIAYFDTMADAVTAAQALNEHKGY